MREQQALNKTTYLNLLYYISVVLIASAINNLMVLRR